MSILFLALVNSLVLLYLYPNADSTIKDNSLDLQSSINSHSHRIRVARNEMKRAADSIRRITNSGELNSLSSQESLILMNYKFQHLELIRLINEFRSINSLMFKDSMTVIEYFTHSESELVNNWSFYKAALVRKLSFRSTDDQFVNTRKAFNKLIIEGAGYLTNLDSTQGNLKMLSLLDNPESPYKLNKDLKKQYVLEHYHSLEEASGKLEGITKKLFPLHKKLVDAYNKTTKSQKSFKTMLLLILNFIGAILGFMVSLRDIEQSQTTEQDSPSSPLAPSLHDEFLVTIKNNPTNISS